MMVERGKVLVLPSVAWEGFHNVVMQAMSVGLPVIASNVPGGVGELLKDGRAGMLVTPGDSEELTGALDKMIGDDELRNDFALAGRQAVEQYKWDATVRRWEQVLSSIC